MIAMVSAAVSGSASTAASWSVTLRQKAHTSSFGPPNTLEICESSSKYPSEVPGREVADVSATAAVVHNESTHHLRSLLVV